MRIGANFPFKPAKFPVFYGWVILGLGVIGMFMTIPGQTIGFSAFTEPLLNALALERTDLSYTYLIGTMINGLVIVHAGKLYDKYGARIVGAVSGMIFGMVLLYLSKIDHIIRFFYSDLQVGTPVVISFIFMSFGFFALRFMGQGMISIVSKNMVMKWFEERRGLVNGILAISISFGFNYSPRVLDMLIQNYSWQGAWQVLAVIIGVLFVVIVLVFFRDNPQECGLTTDGALSEKQKERQSEQAALKNFTLKEARKTYSFWIFNLTLMLNALYITALTFQVEDIFKNAGMGRETALSIFLPSAIVAVALNFAGSALSDYIKLKYLLFIELAGLIVSMLGVIVLNDTEAGIYMIIIGNGLSQGIFGVLNNVTWPKFYGVKYLGAISGYSLGWVIAGSAVGPALFSLSVTYFGNYSYSSGLCLIISVVLLVLGFKAENVNRQPEYP